MPARFPRPRARRLRRDPCRSTTFDPTDCHRSTDRATRSRSVDVWLLALARCRWTPTSTIWRQSGWCATSSSHRTTPCQFAGASQRPGQPSFPGRNRRASSDLSATPRRHHISPHQPRGSSTVDLQPSVLSAAGTRPRSRSSGAVARRGPTGRGGAGCRAQCVRRTPALRPPTPRGGRWSCGKASADRLGVPAPGRPDVAGPGAETPTIATRRPGRSRCSRPARWWPVTAADGAEWDRRGGRARLRPPQAARCRRAASMHR